MNLILTFGWNFQGMVMVRALSSRGLPDTAARPRPAADQALVCLPASIAPEAAVATRRRAAVPGAEVATQRLAARSPSLAVTVLLGVGIIPSNLRAAEIAQCKLTVVDECMAAAYPGAG
jgi:hypothetical protein